MTANVTPGTAPHLSPKQRKAVEALLVTGDVTAAAREAGVSRESIYRWLKQPRFLEAVREAEARALDELSRLLVRLGRTAATTLAKAMSEESTPVATRVRAADVTLARLLQLRELATLEARVAELERAAGLQGDQGWER
jgi:phage terminase small subunit